MVPLVSTDYPVLAVKWQPLSFGLLAFRCSLVTDYTTGLLISGSNRTSRSPLLSVPGSLFIKCPHYQRPKLGAFAPLASSFLPCHQQLEWLPGALFWPEWGPSFGLRWLSINSQYFYRFSKVFPRVVLDSASRAFVVRFPFIDNLLIDALVGICAHPVFNLPQRCHGTFLLHHSFPCLLFLVVRVFLSRVLILYTLRGDRWHRIREFPFFAPAVSEEPPARRSFLSLKSSSAWVTDLTALNHSPSSTYCLCQSRRNALTGSSRSTIFLQAILVTVAWILRSSIAIKD